MTVTLRLKQLLNFKIIRDRRDPAAMAYARNLALYVCAEASPGSVPVYHVMVHVLYL